MNESEMEVTLKKWLDLGERMVNNYILSIDANMAADFYQGIRETKELLKKD